MKRLPAIRGAFFLLLLAVLPRPVPAAPEIIHNSATPIHPLQTMEARELWRIDAEAGDCVLGRIARIVHGHDDRSYILDTQSGDVVVVDQDGMVKGRIGRKGEGPGEYRYPVDLLLTDDCTVGVVQAVPGKVILLTSEGDPLDDLPVPRLWDGPMDLFREGKFAAGRFVVRAAMRDRSDPDYSYVLDGLVGIDPQGEPVTWYRTRSLRRGVAEAHHREPERTLAVSPWTWTVGPDGRVYVNEPYDAYEIMVFDAAGEMVRIIDRDYETKIREGNFRRNLQQAFDESYAGRTYRGSPLTFEVGEYHMDIQEIHARRDGTLWVLPSSGAYCAGPGEMAVFDVFDPQGRFDRQVAVRGEGCYYTDDFFLCDDLIFVVRNSSEDWRLSGDERENHAGRYEVICYSLDGS